MGGFVFKLLPWKPRALFSGARAPAPGLSPPPPKGLTSRRSHGLWEVSEYEIDAQSAKVWMPGFFVLWDLGIFVSGQS